MTAAAPVRLRSPIEPGHDHIRGETRRRGRASVLIYGDYLCPYCRSLAKVLERLRGTLGARMTYVFRHFPNEAAHPGALAAATAAEAAGRQDLFWPMHDALFALQPPITAAHILDAARAAGLDVAQFQRDVADPTLQVRIEEDLADGAHNGVTGTPTIFIDGQRYDGSWDFYSMLEALERPVAARVGRTARAFAALPASAGVVLLLAAAAALVWANAPQASLYAKIIHAPLVLSLGGARLGLSLGAWCSEGLLTVFFLLVGLEIRRQARAGAFADRRAAALPVLCAVGGVAAPALIYLAVNPGVTAAGWSAPTSTGVAFTLAILAVLGARAPPGVKLFVAALAVVDDILSVVTLALSDPAGLRAGWLGAAALAVGAMLLLNRWRVYAGWPYVVATLVLWLFLHLAGVNPGLSGVVLAVLLPSRPTPDTAPLLAQAATALAALGHAEAPQHAGARRRRRLEAEPIWDWASRNLSAASQRLTSPADQVERALSPWGGYVVLPLFAFSATGIPLDVDLASAASRHVLAGVVPGLVLGKPLGIAGTALVASRLRAATLPESVSPVAFLGAAILCGVSDPMALLSAETAFRDANLAAVAKIGVLTGSCLAAAAGALVVAMAPAAVSPSGQHAPAPR